MKIKSMLSNIVNQEVKTGHVFGVVTAISGSTCSVKISGSDEAIDGIRRMNNYTPSVGHTVIILVMDKDLVITGNLA